MLSGLLRSLWRPRLRRLAGILCLVAMAAQLSLAGLHALHETGNLPLACAATDPGPALGPEAPTAHHGARHDPAACPVCRTTPERKALVSPATAQMAPLVLVLRPGPPADDGLRAQSLPRGLAARAPPASV